MELLISAAGAGKTEDVVSLRAWLEAAGDGRSWKLTPVPVDNGILGLGVDEICAVIATVEGLPPLIQAIRAWHQARQHPVPITLTITIDPANGDVTIQLPATSEDRDAQ